jgi:hypothetical protein
MSADGGPRAIVAALAANLGIATTKALAFPGAVTAADVATAIDAAESRVRAVVPIATLIYLEPDLRR